MADFRRVYCTFCKQTFVTASSDECSLCGKQGGLLDDGSPAALQHYRESTQSQPARSPAPIQVSSAKMVLLPPRSKASPKVASFQVPPEVATATEGLGEPLERFATNPLHVWLYIACGAVLVALGLLCFVSLVGALSGGGGMVRPILGCVLFVGGIGLVIRGSSLSGGRCYAFEGGLVRDVGEEYETMRWRDIAVVHRGKVPGENQFTVTTPRRLSLRDQAGREWVFTETLSGFERFRDLVEERTLPSLLASALEALQAGKTLAFGDAGVKTTGLTSPQKPLLGWSSVDQAGIAQGHVVVLAKGVEEPYIAVPLFVMPNSHVFFALIERFREDVSSKEDSGQDGPTARSTNDPQGL